MLADVDRAMVERWVAEGPKRAPGYSVIAIDGPSPDDLVEQIVACKHVMNTAPRESLELDDAVLTVDQEREMERSIFARGFARRLVVARHDATGALVGFTELSHSDHELPETVWQWGTGVAPEHRGHALGKWLKAVNLLRVMDEWPDAADIRTHNADSNDPMLGINHALGFKPFTVDISWQVPVDKARAYVDGR
jgi:GNAT superfamily N-acetyltransferase